MNSVCQNLLGVCTALTFTAGAVFANESAGFSGDISFYHGNLILQDSYDNDYSFNDGSVTGLAFRLRRDFSQGWFGQLDYNGETIVDGSSVGYPGGNNYSYSVRTLSAHLGGSTGNFTYGAMVSLGEDSGW